MTFPSERPRKSSSSPENKDKPKSKPKFKDLATATEDAVLRVLDPNFKGIPEVPDDGG